MKTFLENKMKL